MRSIQNVILLGVAVASLLAAAAMLLLTEGSIHHESEEVFDATLVQSTRLIRQLLPPSASFNRQQADLLRRSWVDIDEEWAEKRGHHSGDRNDPGHYYENKLAFQIQDKQGNTLLSLPEQVRLPLPDHAGFENHQYAGQQWRRYSQFDESRGLWISSAQILAIRQEIAEDISRNILLPMLGVSLLLLLSIALLVRRGLRPLRNIGRELDQRSSRDLTPLNDRRLPAELKTPARALNNMFQRVAETLEREKRFTDDAAHELRTPLAAMRLHLQRLPQDLQAVDALQQGLQRTERLVTQLLQLARLEPDRSDEDFQDFDLHADSAEIIAELYPQAQQRGMTLELLGPAPCPMHGQPLLIQVLLRNLLENAIRYSHDGDAIQVRLQHQEGAVGMSVIDHGPGLDAEQCALVSRRFYRLDKSDSQGAGLGLAIAEAVIERHQGHYRLKTTDGGGLSVEVRFP